MPAALHGFTHSKYLIYFQDMSQKFKTQILKYNTIIVGCNFRFSKEIW